MSIHSSIDKLDASTCFELINNIPYASLFTELIRKQNKISKFEEEYQAIYIPTNTAILGAIEKMRLTYEQFENTFKFDEQIDFHFRRDTITQDDYGKNFNVLATYSNEIESTTVYIIDTLLNVRNLGTVIKSDNAYDGYTLFSPMRQGNTFMIDNNGDTVHTWYGNSSIQNTIRNIMID